MSTIMNALRRLEVDEKVKSQEQSLHDVEGAQTAGRRWRSAHLWILGGVAVLVGLGAGMLLRTWLAEDAPPIPQSTHVAPPRVDSVVVEPQVPARVPDRSADPVPRKVEMAPVVGSPPALRPSEIRVASQTRGGPVRGSAGADTDGSNAAVVSAAPPPVPPSAVPMTAIPMRPVEPPVPPSPSPQRVSPTVAEGPLIVVSELPVVVPIETPPPAAPVAEVVPKVVSQPLKVPVVAAAPPAVLETRSKSVPPAPPQPASPASREPSSIPKVASRPPEKVVGVADTKRDPEPAVAPASLVPVAASSTALPPVATLDARVLRTVWHPNAARRIAYLSAGDVPSEAQFEEGDLWRGWRLVEIKMSGVAFERDGVRRYLRVGEGK